MSSVYLPFTLGENMGKNISSIAYEHLYNGDITKCLNVFNSLLSNDGTPIDFIYVKSILLDKSVLVVKDDSMYLEDKSKHPDYPTFNLRELFIRKAKKLDDTIKELYKLIGYLKYDKCYTATIRIPVKEIYQFAFTNNNDILTSRFLDAIEYDYNDISILISIIKEIQYFIDVTKPSITKILTFINDNFINDIKDISFYNRYIDEIKPDLSNIFDTIEYKALQTKYLAVLKYTSVLLDKESIENYSEDEILEEYELSNIQNIMNTLTNININLDKLSPSDLTEEFDAGWISREGLLYALDGPESMLLHMRIADELYNKGIIPSEFKDNPEQYLEQSGWIKIHYNNVLYFGYYHNKKITSKQFKTLRIICERLKGLQLGYRKKPISLEEFKQLDDDQLKTLLKF